MSPSCLPFFSSSTMLGLPAAATKVGNQSRPDMMPFSTLPAGTLPGQRMMAGTRKPPSRAVPLPPAKGVCPPSGQVKFSAPLSVVKTTIVSSSSPLSLHIFHDRADDVVELSHAGFLNRSSRFPSCACASYFSREVRDDVHARRVEPQEERLAVGLRLVDELERVIEDLVVHRLHPLRDRACRRPRSSACRSCPSAAARSDRRCRWPSVWTMLRGPTVAEQSCG